MSGEPKDTVVLAGCLDFSGVNKLAADLLDTHTDLPMLQINAADVEQIGTPAVQVLLSAARQVVAEGRRFVVINETEAFREAFDDLGLSEQVEEWSNT